MTKKRNYLLPVPRNLFFDYVKKRLTPQTWLTEDGTPDYYITDRDIARDAQATLNIGEVTIGHVSALRKAIQGNWEVLPLTIAARIKAAAVKAERAKRKKIAKAAKAAKAPRAVKAVVDRPTTLAMVIDGMHKRIDNLSALVERVLTIQTAQAKQIETIEPKETPIPNGADMHSNL